MACGPGGRGPGRRVPGPPGRPLARLGTLSTVSEAQTRPGTGPETGQGTGPGTGHPSHPSQPSHEDLPSIRSRITAGGAKKYHASAAAAGKLFARDRIALLVDLGALIVARRPRIAARSAGSPSFVRALT